MLWLAIHFPELPTDLWTQTHSPGSTDDATVTLPLAIVEQRRICRANAAARTQGVKPGISAATAAALCAGLLLRERQPEQERRRLAQLAQGALVFTPNVCIDDMEADAPTLLLEIGGCLRLFHGLAALRKRIDTHIAAQQVSVQIALAPTAIVARLFAVNHIDTDVFFDDDGHADTRAVQAALAALPVHNLGLDSRTEESLMQMGFRQFSDINTLPRQAMGRRFGNGFIHWLDRVTGVRADPRQPIAPETFYVREMNFLDGIVHSEGLVFPMQRLLGDFAQFLRRQQFATQQITWRFTHVDRSTQEIVLNTTRPETSPAQLLALTRVRLESTKLPAPVETLRLACRRFLPLAAPDRVMELFPTANGGAQQEAGISTLVDRLRARLGDAHCRQFTPAENWQADAAHSRRPLWLLREPARIFQQGTQLQWQGSLDIVSGPERIDSEWWAQPVQRDYFVAHHEAGTLCWIFHDHARGMWFVHGVFG